MPQPSKPAPDTPILELQSVDSTNNYARKLINEGLAQPGTLIFTHEQTAGRGQRGKSWQSERDKSMLISLMIDPAPLPPGSQFQLSACISLACHLFISKKLGDSGKIKWPNDLYWQDRKAGGILIENIIAGDQWKWAIIGIGININQSEFPQLIQNPVSLRQVSGEAYDLLELIGELHSEILAMLDRLKHEGFLEILSLYNQHLYKKNEVVRFRKGARVFEAVVKEVNFSGRLIVMHGIEEEIEWGEVEWL